jgi:hypothetical protein
MPKINWQFLLDNLEDRQCILCIGPDIYAHSGAPRFETQLATFLRTHAEGLNIRVYDNGWFHYLPGYNKSSVWKKLDEFYKRPNERVDAILEKLSCLPFEAIISFSPDYRVRDIFVKNRPNTQFKAFEKNVSCDAEMPTVEKPLVFNLMGELKKGNSLVLTYKDYYEYLKSVFDEKGIPDKLAEKIADAQHFIFLGLPFDKWYTHLFMNLINDLGHNNKNKDHNVHRIAANPFLEASDMERASEQHALTFVADKISDFVNELYKRCQENNLLITDSDKPSEAPTTFDVWRRYMKTGDSHEILRVLDEMTDFTEGDDGDLNTVINLTGQYNRFLSTKNRRKFGTQKEEEAAENNIVDGILNTISMLEKHS